MIKPFLKFLEIPLIVKWIFIPVSILKEIYSDRVSDFLVNNLLPEWSLIFHKMSICSGIDNVKDVYVVNWITILYPCTMYLPFVTHHMLYLRNINTHKWSVSIIPSDQARKSCEQIDELIRHHVDIMSQKSNGDCAKYTYIP